MKAGCGKLRGVINIVSRWLACLHSFEPYPGYMGREYLLFLSLVLENRGLPFQKHCLSREKQAIP